MKYLLKFIILCLAFNAHSDVYKWTDDKGRIYYGDSKHKTKNAVVKSLDLKINTYKITSFERSNVATDRVIMYSSSWCGYCKKARKYFIANRIPYSEYDVDRNQRAKRRYEKLGATGVPVILYKNRRMNGFSVSGFKRIYKNGA